MKLTKKQQEIIRKMRSGVVLTRYSTRHYYLLSDTGEKVTKTAEFLCRKKLIQVKEYDQYNVVSREYELTPLGKEVHLSAGADNEDGNH